MAVSTELSSIVDSIQCPQCNGESHVIDSRDGETARRRRRQCDKCNYRYSTYEIHAEEYDRLRSLRLDVGLIESVITTLCSIRAKLGSANGTAKD